MVFLFNLLNGLSILKLETLLYSITIFDWYIRRRWKFKKHSIFKFIFKIYKFVNVFINTTK